MLAVLALPLFIVSAHAETPPDDAAAVAVVESARIQALAARMRARGGPSFTVVVEPPYVIAGDGAPEDIRRRARQTVAWAHGQLRERYFAQDPADPVAVWLFRDHRSYVSHVRAWLGETPDTPYGFADDTGLYMNIATGGGTLIHELVHPLVATNLPDCPPWFNEGLASLYEATGVRDGRMHGLVNWRLPGLQAGIRNGAVPSLPALMAQDSRGFYRDPAGLHYGAARYLLYYLQEQGLLDRYYAELGGHMDEDPTGVAALRRVLGREDLAAFQREWEAWVLALEL